MQAAIVVSGGGRALVMAGAGTQEVSTIRVHELRGAFRKSRLD